MIDRNSQFVSCPMSNLVLGGSKKIEDITLQLRQAARLRRAGDTRRSHRHRHRQEDVSSSTRIEDLPYDRLVLSPGIDFMYDQIPGLNNAEAQKTILHAWKAGPETVALRKQLEEMRDGGIYVMSIPKAPYRCPPGPYERACQVALYFKQAKPKSKVLILDGNEDIVSKKGLFLKAWGDRYKGIIEYRNNQEAKDIDLRRHGGQDRFRYLQGRRAQRRYRRRRPADIAAKAGIINANNRWCERGLAHHAVDRESGHPCAWGRDAVGAGHAQVGRHGQPARQGMRRGDRRTDDRPAVSRRRW